MSDLHRPQRTSAGLSPGWLGRLTDWRSLLRAAGEGVHRHPRLAIGGAAVVLAAVIGAAALLPLTIRSPADFHRQLQAGLALLESGNVEGAREIAQDLRGVKQLAYADRGAVLYILGTATAADAEVHTSPREQQVLFLIASRYLEEARLCGFPSGYEGEGLWLLGKCLVRGGRPDQALPILKQSLAAASERKLENLELLIAAALQARPPQLQLALQYNRRYLAASGLTPPKRDQGQLQQAEIHLLLEDAEAGRAALEKVPEQSTLQASVRLLRVRLLLMEVDRWAETRPGDETLPAEMHDALAAALPALEELVQSRHLDGATRGAAQLLAARCLARLDEQGKAISLFVRIRRTDFGSPLALAAAIFEASLHRENGRFDEALQIYERAIRDATLATVQNNPWLAPGALERELSETFRRLIDAGDYSRAVDLARLLPPLLDETLSYQWRAEAEHAWAERLLAQAASRPLAAGEPLRSEARLHFRQAGADYERLAELRIMTRHYLDDLSRSATDFLAGHGFMRAAAVYRRFLESDPQEGRAEALTGLGEALLAIGRPADALRALDLCGRSYPRHPASFRARYLASLAHSEQGNLEEAKKLLVDNLYNHSLTPESGEWRDSLFALGKLRWREATEAEIRASGSGPQRREAENSVGLLDEREQAHAAFQEAIHLLDEAVRRYPQAERSIEARYLLADSHRRAARWPRHRLEGSASETARAPLVRQMKEALDAAVTEFASLIAELGNDGDGKGQSPLARSILRNSYFGHADSLFELGRYEEAAAAYSAATNRYQNEPEALSAYLQIAACYRRQDRQVEARGTLEQARLVLARIRKDADFLRTTPYTRDEWGNLLTWLSAL